MRWLVSNFEEALAGILLALILAIIFLGVLFRYAVSQPFQWSDEIAMGLFIWLIFIGSAVASKRGMHIGIDMLVILLPEGVQRVLRTLVYLLLIITLGSIVFFGWQFANSTWLQYTLNLQIPRFWVHLAAPVGALLMLRWTIFHMLKSLSGEAPLKQAAEVEL